MGRADLPGEEEQYEAYASVVKVMAGRPVTIRTLDIGADKTLDGEATVATNPALGQRAIRYCLARPEMFATQLRAILRASAHGPVRLLIPMIAHMHEVVATKAAIEAARRELDARGQAYAAHMEVGAMVEVPAIAIAIEPFAQALDFLSIGTNDLIQYTLAIDRGDHDVASLYDPLHPAVLRLVANTINAGERAGKPVAVCGEMAGDSRMTRLLLGLGLTEFSMHPQQLLDVKREVRRAHSNALRIKVASALNRACRWTWTPSDQADPVSEAPAAPGAGLPKSPEPQGSGLLSALRPALAGRVGSAVVRRFAVAGDVQPFALLVFRHAQAAQGVGDLVGDQGHHAGPDDGQQHAFELHPELMSDHAGLGQAGAAQGLGIEHAGQQRADDAAHAVHAEHVQRVVGAQDALQAIHAPDADDAGDHADDQRARGTHQPGGRGDADQAGYRARGRAEHGRLALDAPFGDQPGQHGAGGRDHGVEEGQRGVFVGGQAEPALKPNQPTHSSAAPTKVMGRLCGCMASRP